MKRLAMALALSVSFSGVALSKNVAACGASQGYGYYPKTGRFAESKDGGKWYSDSISQGKLTLTRKGVASGAYDILFEDASGKITSASANRGSVLSVGRSGDALAIVVNYPGATVETYMFVNSANGPEVVWSQNKYGSPVLKVAAFRAPCSFMDLN